MSYDLKRRINLKRIGRIIKNMSNNLNNFVKENLSNKLEEDIIKENVFGAFKRNEIKEEYLNNDANISKYEMRKVYREYGFFKDFQKIN